jgi:Flp pilus assembly protein TadG
MLMSDKPSAERGQVLVIAVIFMVVLLVSGALAVDYGSWLSARRDFQSVSDAASLAAAAQLPPPGQGAASLAQRQSAAIEALVYLSDHFGWGLDRTSPQLQADANAVLQNTAPLVVSGGGYSYCVWIWTPTPSATDTITGAAGCMGGAVGSTIYSPATYPSDGRKVLVRIQSFRPAYLARIVGFSQDLVSAIAVAGGVHLNYAVIALKPRLGSPDSQFGVTINGGSHLIVPSGDVGGNYSLQWGGSGSSIEFTAGQSQVLDLQEPGTVQGSGNVVNGTIHQLEDPIQDPLYGTPASCMAAVASPCWADWPPTTPVTATNKGVYPACENSADINNHRLDLSCLSNAELALPITIWPGKYEQIKLPSGAANVIMSPTCFATDTACTADNRGGIFYLSSSSPSSGLLMNGTPGYPSMLTGCGVLLIFDPHESGGGTRVQMNVAGNGNTLNLNADSCNMKSSPRNPGGTILYRWYGYDASDFTNPISVWVRPNRIVYDMTSTNNGSNVITMGSGATITENGVIYAPEDNTIVSGGPAGSGVGQIVSWTITYTGGSNITESFQGPAKLRTRLYQ